MMMMRTFLSPLVTLQNSLYDVNTRHLQCSNASKQS